MVRNNFAQDIDRLQIWSGKKKYEAANAAGMKGQYVTELKHGRHILNRAFVRLVEAFGYDIEVKYIKREESSGGTDSE